MENWEAATLMGIDIQRVYLLSFVMGAALAGVAGALVSVGYSIEPTMGMSWTLKGLIVMVLGGLGSITGDLCGRPRPGCDRVSDRLLSSASPTERSSASVLFLLVLIFRPQGLFGAKEG